jgi:hemoglobin
LDLSRSEIGFGWWPAFHPSGGVRVLVDQVVEDITAVPRFRFASLKSLATDPEFRAALAGYLEWGTRLAMHNSQPGADVAQQAPVPGWD